MILTKQKTAPCLLSAAAILYCVLLIINAEAVTDGITESIFRCINIIVPSLFAFMAVSGVIIKSRIYSYISKPFHFFSKYILNVPDNLFLFYSGKYIRLPYRHKTSFRYGQGRKNTAQNS